MIAEGPMKPNDILPSQFILHDRKKIAEAVNARIAEMASCVNGLGDDHEIDVEPFGYDGWKVLDTCKWCQKKLILLAVE